MSEEKKTGGGGAKAGAVKERYYIFHVVEGTDQIVKVEEYDEKTGKRVETRLELDLSEGERESSTRARRRDEVAEDYDVYDESPWGHPGYGPYGHGQSPYPPFGYYGVMWVPVPAFPFPPPFPPPQQQSWRGVRRRARPRTPPRPFEGEAGIAEESGRRGVSSDFEPEGPDVKARFTSFDPESDLVKARFTSFEPEGPDVKARFLSFRDEAPAATGGGPTATAGGGSTSSSTDKPEGGGTGDAGSKIPKP